MTSRSPTNLFMGGYGSGKTKVMGDASIYFASKFPTVKGLIAANTYGQLTKSTMFRIREVWKQDYNINEYNDTTKKGEYVVGKKPPANFKKIYTSFDTYGSIISFKTGAIIFIGSLDNYPSLDGMEVGWVMLDETKDTKEDAMTVIVGRLRQKGIFLKSKEQVEQDSQKGDYSVYSDFGQESINPLFVFTAPAKTAWLNDYFGLDLLPKTVLKRSLQNPPYYYSETVGHRKVVFSSTYVNEDNLPSSYIENMENNMLPHLRDMYVFGYPFAAAGGEFYAEFRSELHVKPCYYRPELPIHISFDENVVPYMPCGIWQADGLELFKIQEIDLPEPYNNVYAVCEEIIKIYKDHSEAVYIYGDATSQKRDVKLKKERPQDTVNFFTIIRKALNHFRTVRLRVPSANPSVARRGEFINHILGKNIHGISISLDPCCKNSIKDYERIQMAETGGKEKKVTRDPVTKKTYQELGHDSDLDDYFIVEYCRKQFRMFQNSTEKGASTANSYFPTNLHSKQY